MTHIRALANTRLQSQYSLHVADVGEVSLDWPYAADGEKAQKDSIASVFLGAWRLQLVQERAEIALAET